MSMGLITVDITIAGAVEFVRTSPVVTFAEVTASTTVDQQIRLRGYSYNSTGAAHSVDLRLTRPPGPSGTSADIILVQEDGVNSFARLCDVIIPREYGVVDTVQPPVATDTAIAPYQLFFATTGKLGNGTFVAWYDFVTPDR